MIRATSGGRLDLVAERAADLASAVRLLEEKATSGLAVSRSSDAPSTFAQVQSLSAIVADQAVYQSAANDAIGVHNIMDAALGDAGDILARAREIAVAMSSEVYSADERAVAAKEVEALRDSLLTLANTRFGERYVFAGTAWDAPAFDDAGAYQGSTDVPAAQVSARGWVETGADGSAAFTGTVDVFAVLDDLAAALNSNSVSDVQSSLGDLDSALDQLVDARTEVGVQTNFAEDSIAVAENMAVAVGESLASLRDADPAETYLQLGEMRNAYSAALQVAASASRTTLFDLLG